MILAMTAYKQLLGLMLFVANLSDEFSLEIEFRNYV